MSVQETVKKLKDILSEIEQTQPDEVDACMACEGSGKAFIDKDFNGNEFQCGVCSGTGAVNKGWKLLVTYKEMATSFVPELIEEIERLWAKEK